MSKLFTLIIAFLIICSSAYSWEEADGYEYISVNNRLKDIALTSDADMLYSLGIDHHITKYDAISGDKLWDKEIAQELPDSTTLCDSFLSEDGLSYVLIYNYLDSMSFKCRIFDIESDELINECYFANDSFDGEFYLLDISSFEFLKADYISSKSVLLINEYMDASRSGPGGVYAIYVNGDYGIIKAFDFNESDDYTVYTTFYPIIKYDLTSSKNGVFFHVIDSTHIYYQSQKSQVNSFVKIRKEQEFRFWDLDSSKSTLFDYPMDYEDEIKYSYHGDKLCILENDKHWIVYDLSLDTIVYHSIVTGLDELIEMSPIRNDLSALMYDNKIDVYSVDNGTLVYSYKTPDEVLYDLTTINNSDYIYCLSETKRIIRFNNFFETDNLTSLFAVSTQNAIVGDEIFFEDLSLGNPESYLWDFGDGKSSTEKNPMHIYDNPGYFNVS